MTPGRVAEALATAATAGLSNVFLHVDWNQASIDSNWVCRDGEKAGEYVQWNPCELAYLHDWNVYRIDDGKDFRQILAALQAAVQMRANDQPSALVYRTVKGWKYGIEGRGSHGAGHKFLSDSYYASLKEAEDAFGVRFPRHEGETTPDAVERTFWNTLLVFRALIEKEEIGAHLATQIRARREGLKQDHRSPRPERPDLSPLYGPKITAEAIPADLQLKPGSESTLRAALGDALGYLNRETKGGIIAAAADLLGSTSVSNAAKGFPEGFYHSRTNPGARLAACGGICEDSMGAFLAGVSTYGTHIGIIGVP